MLTNPSDAFIRQMSLIWYHSMLGMVSYYCAVVTLSVRRTVFEIFDFKNAVILKTVLGVRQGH